MEELQQKIGDILKDPAQLAGILELAKSFGLAPPQQASDSDAAPLSKAAPASEAAEPLESTASPLPPPQSALAGQDAAQSAGSFLQAGKPDNRQENLLRALRPFLKPEKQEKIDRAVQIARLARLAQTMLKDPSKGR